MRPEPVEGHKPNMRTSTSSVRMQQLSAGAPAPASCALSLSQGTTPLSRGIPAQTGRRVIARTSRAASSCSSVSAPLATKPFSMTTSRMVLPSLRACLATAAAFS